MCSTNPDTYKLLLGMFQDLMECEQRRPVLPSFDGRSVVHRQGGQRSVPRSRARQGTGKPEQAVGGIHAGRPPATYTIMDASHFLGRRAAAGRRYSALPDGLINGEVYSTAYNKAFRARGIPQMIYTNSLPDDPLFPAYSCCRRRNRCIPQRWKSAPPAPSTKSLSPRRARRPTSRRGNLRLGRQRSASGNLLAGLRGGRVGGVASGVARSARAGAQFLPAFLRTRRAPDGARVPT